MNDRNYAFLCYWGPFGHANNSANIKKTNDLIDSFDWLSMRKDQPYPVFANASCNSKLPWPDNLNSKEAGQINAFFRWKNFKDTAEILEISLFLVSPNDLDTKFKIPTSATSDLTLRRLQNFKIKPGERFKWEFGSAKGETKVGALGLITIRGLKITDARTILRIRAKKS